MTAFLRICLYIPIISGGGAEHQLTDIRLLQSVDISANIYLCLGHSINSTESWLYACLYIRGTITGPEDGLIFQPFDRSYLVRIKLSNLIRSGQRESIVIPTLRLKRCPRGLELKLR